MKTDSNLSFLKNALLTVVVLASAVYFTGCSLNPSRDKVRVQIAIGGGGASASSSRGPASKVSQAEFKFVPSQGSGDANYYDYGQPTSVDSFDCYAVNVMGPGLDPYGSGPNPMPTSTESPYPYASPATEPSGTPSSSPTPGPSSEYPYDYSQMVCSYPGATSVLVNGDESEITLEIPSGPSRTIQVIGIKTWDGSGCPLGTNLLDYMNSIHQKYYEGDFSTSMPMMFELGSTTADLFFDATVEVRNVYNPYETRHAFGCYMPDGYDYPYATPTYAPDYELPLVGAWKGFVGTGGYADQLPGGTVSLPLTNLVAFSGPERLDLDNSSSATTYTYTKGNDLNFAAMDFAFDVSGVVLSDYSRLHIEVTGVGGTSYQSAIDACAAVPAFDAPNGLQVRVYDRANNAWSTQGGGNTASSPSVTNYSSYGDVNLIDMPVSVSGEVNGLVIYVSVRSDQVSSWTGTPPGVCSALGVQWIKARLVP